MKTVKPREVFNLLQGDENPFVSIRMPLGPLGNEPGEGITLLETFALIAVARKIKARRIFEFGTHRGATAIALAMNVADVRVVSIDECEYPEALQCDNLKITRHIGNSMAFEPPENYLQSFDMVWIDAGHEPGPFWSDTRMGKTLLRPGGVMCWHDCGSPNANPPKWPNVEEWLEANSQAVKIQSTTLAVEGLL